MGKNKIAINVAPAFAKKLPARLRHSGGRTGKHKLPVDLRKAIDSIASAHTAWGNITPLAKNEWICWIESAKKPETRSHRINRTKEELIKGKRRPCCWAGCPHR